jgi:hypothetical protein
MGVSAFTTQSEEHIGKKQILSLEKTDLQLSWGKQLTSEVFVIIKKQRENVHYLVRGRRCSLPVSFAAAWVLVISTEKQTQDVAHLPFMAPLNVYHTVCQN